MAASIVRCTGGGVGLMAPSHRAPGLPKQLLRGDSTKRTAVDGE
jgi:hypothetical protein